MGSEGGGGMGDGCKGGVLGVLEGIAGDGAAGNGAGRDGGNKQP